MVSGQVFHKTKYQHVLEYITKLHIQIQMYFILKANQDNTITYKTILTITLNTKLKESHRTQRSHWH